MTQPYCSVPATQACSVLHPWKEGDIKGELLRIYGSRQEKEVDRKRK
jgi:hypothetical protein